MIGGSRGNTDNFVVMDYDLFQRFYPTQIVFDSIWKHTEAVIFIFSIGIQRNDTLIHTRTKRIIYKYKRIQDVIVFHLWMHR